MNNPYLVDMLETARTFPGQVRASFGDLTELQLNWRPGPETWSIGLGLEHIIHSDQLYMPQLISLRVGNHRGNFWTKARLMSGFFERKLLKITDPGTPTKSKAPGMFLPTLSEVEPDILDRFANHSRSLLETITSLDHLNHDEVYLHSPVSKLVTLRLSVVTQLFVNHTQRHINQAKTLLEHPGFPAAVSA